MDFSNPPWYDRIRNLSAIYWKEIANPAVTQRAVDAILGMQAVRDGEISIYQRVLREAEKLISKCEDNLLFELNRKDADEKVSPLPVRMPTPKRKSWSGDAVKQAVMLAGRIQAGRVAAQKPMLEDDDLMRLVEDRLTEQGILGGTTFTLKFVTPPPALDVTPFDADNPDFRMGV